MGVLVVCTCGGKHVGQSISINYSSLLWHRFPGTHSGVEILILCIDSHCFKAQPAACFASRRGNGSWWWSSGAGSSHRKPQRCGYSVITNANLPKLVPLWILQFDMSCAWGKALGVTSVCYDYCSIAWRLHHVSIPSSIATPELLLEREMPWPASDQLQW